MRAQMARDEAAVEVVGTTGLEACHDGDGLAAKVILGARMANRCQRSRHQRARQSGSNVRALCPVTSRTHRYPRPRCEALCPAERSIPHLGLFLEHDPETWNPVFGTDHARTESETLMIMLIM